MLRWANSTMTTNGHTVERRLTVIALVPARGRHRRGRRHRAGPAGLPDGPEGDAVLTDAVAGAVQAARAGRSRPRRGAAARARRRGRRRTGTSGAEDTSIGVFARLAEELGASFRPGEASFGFAEPPRDDDLAGHLGRACGAAGCEPAGSVELNLKDPATGTSVWGGRGRHRLRATSTSAALVERLREPAARGARGGSTCPAGRYETLLPPSAVSDLMIYLAWSMGGRPAQEGRSALLAGRAAPGSASGSATCP